MKYAKLLVKKILENPLEYEWSLQGFGMLRLYLSSEVRLHVWDSSFSVEGVSTIHTHPWDFTSRIVAGSLENIVYSVDQDGSVKASTLHSRQTIKCGPGGCLMGSPIMEWLYQSESVHMTEGDMYSEEAETIHESRPLNGTVTLVDRSFKVDRDHAYVYWKDGERWVSAEPRKAYPHEILQIANNSLSSWF